MKIRTVTEAKAHLSRLIAVVRQGETILITHRGRPVARLEPVRDFAETPETASLDHLVRSGVVRRGREASRAAVLPLPPPRPKRDPSLLRALLDERDGERL